MVVDQLSKLRDLLDQLNDPLATNRLSALQQIAAMRIHHLQIVERILPLAEKDPDEKVRSRAIKALEELRNYRQNGMILQEPIFPPIIPVLVDTPASVDLCATTEQKMLHLLEEQNRLLQDIKRNMLSGSGSQQPLPPLQSGNSVYIQDIPMSIGAMVAFLVKWTIAGIVVFFIFAIPFLLIFANAISKIWTALFQ